MFISINRLCVKPGTGEQLEQRFAQAAGLDDTPGFVRFQLLRRSWQAPHVKDEHAEYLSMTEWTSRDAFLAWLQSDAFREAHSKEKLDIFVAPAIPAGYDIALERQPQSAANPE